MKFYFILFLLGAFSFVSTQAQEKILWKEDGLSWEDFKASPNKSSSFHANTNAGISYSWGVKNENGIIELKYEVLSFFNPIGSWVKPGSKNDYLLQHEQLHFDITELYARKLRKKLSEVKIIQLGKDPKTVLNKYYQNIERERALMQQKYDRETNHSLNKDAEAKWQEFVKRELQKYEEMES